MAAPNATLLVPDVVLLPHADYKQKMLEVLEQSGYTFEELRVQAEADEFETERARLTWLMVRD